jgi:tetratricopeptide (TPR) repeat protein
MLRLEHLDAEAARDAITRPLDEYNRRRQDGQSMSIEPELVEAVLNDLRGVMVTSERSERSPVGQPSSERKNAEIETPFLQMVLLRLWDEERAAGSRVLRLQTFEALGRAENIARTHLDTVMNRLTAAEHIEAAGILRYLVTPSGTKIAQEAGALASWTELTEKDVQRTLTRLSAPDMRILRTIQAPGQVAHYEIFHDVLAQAILNWRRRYVAQQQEEKIRQEAQERIKQDQAETERRQERERARRLRRLVIGLAVLSLVMAGLLVYAFRQKSLATDYASKAQRAAEGKAWAEEQTNKADAELEALRNRQREAEQHILKGRAYLKSNKDNRFSDAVREYDEAIRLDPNNPSAISTKGYALMRDGKYPEAIGTLEALKSKYPDYIWAPYNLALVYHLAGKTELALKEAKAVIAIDPSFCSTFWKDANYSWFADSREYPSVCPRQGQAPPQ